MRDFIFDIQRFAVTYEFTTGNKTFENSAYAYYYAPDNNHNEKTLNIGYNIEYHSDSDGNLYTVQGADITLAGDHRILRGSGYMENHFANYVQMYGSDYLGSFYGSYVQIHGSDGDNIIHNGGNVYYSFGSWSWWPGGNHNMVYAGAGKDTIENWDADYTTIYADAGDDVIYNDYTCDNALILCGSGDDSFWSGMGKNTSIDGGDGNDTIENDYGSNVSILGGKGDDYIYNAGDGAALGWYMTIDAGDDNDYIDNSQAMYVSINAGDGNDSIRNYNGRNLTINGGTGNDYIDSWGNSNSSISGGTGNDSIYSDGDNVTISSGTGNDSIFSAGDNVTIDAGEDNDLVILEYSYDNLIKLGGGSDTIKMNGYILDNTIDAGEDNDLIVLESGNNHLIKLGGGSDTIKISGHDMSFSVADWSEDDVIEFDNAVTYVETIDGGTVINGSVTIGGVSVAEEDEIKWRLDENTHVATYGGKTSGGNAVLSADRMSITYKKTTDRSGALIRIGGIADVGGMDPVNKTVNLSPANFTAGGANVMSNTFKYAFALSGDFNKNSFTADKEDDTISSTAHNVTIKSGAGNDTLYNSGLNNSIDGGSGNDTVENYGAGASIDAGAGADSIYNAMESGETTIYGGADNDSILNGGYSVFIDAGTEDDIIENTGSAVTVAGGDGADSIVNYGGDNTSINTGGGSNTISNGIFEGHFYLEYINMPESKRFFVDNELQGGQFATIEAGTGNDSIFNNASDVLIDGGDGNNTITSGAFIGHIVNYKTEYGADGGSVFSVDKTVSGGDNVTITTGKNDDDIQFFNGSSVKIKTADGDDTVSIGGVCEKISIDTGNNDDSIYLTNVKGGNVDSKTGELPVNDKKSSDATINAGNGRNIINVDGGWEYVTINGGNSSADIDLISNAADDSFIKANAGNDAIKNSGNFASLSGGADGDIIENLGDNAYISGDNFGDSLLGGNDYIFTDKGNNVKIDAGGGHDLIEAWHDVGASISGGAGNDRIHLYRVSSSDTQNILWKAGTILVSNILNYFDKYTKITKDVSILDVAAVASFLNDTFKSLYTAKDIADIVKGVGIAAIDLKVMPISSILELKTSLDELTMTESTINGGTGNDTIVSDGFAPRVFQYKLNDGNDEIHNFATNKNSGDDATYLSTLYITAGDIEKVTVDNTDVIFTIGEGSVKLVDAANHKFKLREADGTLTTRAYGKDSATGAVICSIFGSAANDDIQDNVGIKRDKTTYIGVDVEVKDTIIGETNANVIYGNGGNDNLRGNDKDDTIYGAGGNDYIVGNSGNDVLYGYGGANTIYGGKGNDTIYNSGNNAFISAGDDNDTVENYGDKVTIETGDGKDKITSHGDNNSISAGDDNDTIEVHHYNVTAQAGAGNDSIRVGSITGSDSTDTFNIKINAGGDNDTVESYVSNVTIAGNAGDDLIILSASADRNFIDYKNGDGHDEIRGLTDDDTFKISSGNVSKVTVENSDVILTIGEGSVRLKNFSNKEFKFTAADGEIFKCKLFADSVTKEVAGSIVGGKGQTTLYGTSSGDRFYGSNADDVIYGNNGNDNLYGEGGNDSILGGDGNDYIDGGNGTNTLDGGKGNDTIYAGGSNNLIIYNYGDGNDRIFGAGTLRILGAGYSSLESQGNMILKVGDEEVILVNNSDGRYFKVEGTYLGDTKTIQGGEDSDSPITTPADTTPADTTPVEPTPDEPTPIEPTPVEPTPVEPTPVEPTPVEPTPVEPTPIEPTPVEPTPVEPTPVEPTPVEPTPVEPTPVEPTPVEPTPVEPTLEGATVIDGTAVTLSSDDKEIFIGTGGATISDYDLGKTFINGAANAQELIDSDFTLDKNIFYAEGQKPIVLEDYDTSRGTFVNIKTADGRKNIFGWSPQSGGLVDGNSIDRAQIIFGDAPNGNSTIRGGNRNDSIYAGARDVVSLSGGHDELHINDETSHGVTVDMGDGSAQSRTRVVDGFDVTRDLLKIDSPENINARILDGSLQFIKGDSRLTFDELATFDDANGLQVQVDGATYELRNDYDSGLSDVDYFWTDTDGNYYITDSTFRIFDDGSTREYFIAEGSGKRTIDGFNFGRDNDKLNVTTINGLTAYGDNLYITSGDSDIVEVTGGAGKTIDVKLDGTTYTAQLGKHLTYDLDAEYYGDLHGGTGCAISVATNFAHEEVAIYLNEEEEADGKTRYYGGVTKIDASAFTGRASLVGSEFNDQIIAAQGDTSLWGGESGDDELFGTGSGNSFFYCLGNGDDKIYNAANGDSVNLVDIRLEDITNSAISAEAVTLELSDGGRLTVMNSADVTFNLGDGTSWKADRQSKEWQQQA